MKKKQIICIICLCICCTFALLLIRYNVDADDTINLPEPNFEAGEPHSNPVAFRLYFQTMSSTTGSCTVSIQDDIYDEQQAIELWYAIQSDLSILYDKLSLNENDLSAYTIYIVETALNGIQVAGNYLYCTPTDILNGDYRESLISVVFFDCISEPWKQIGLTEYLYGSEIDSTQLAVYLTSNVDILSLYAAYFVQEFASEEEISMAQTAAQLLCEHVITEYGTDILIKDSCTEYRQELLNKLGIAQVYNDPYDDFDYGYTYSHNADYPLIVTTTRGDVFYLQVMPDDMETAADVRHFLYDASVGPLIILDGIKTDAPEYADILAKNYSAPFNCYLDPTQYGSVTTYLNTIKLGNTSDIVHEIMHIMVPTNYELWERWKYEAIAQYLNDKYYPIRGRQEEFFEAFTRIDNGSIEEFATDEDNLLLMQECYKAYLVSADLPKSVEEVDGLLAEIALMKACYITNYELPSIAEVHKMTNLTYLQEVEGNALSYLQALAFADYVIREYSLSMFLQFCLNDMTFKETYGIDFETVKTAWMKESGLSY